MGTYAGVDTQTTYYKNSNPQTYDSAMTAINSALDYISPKKNKEQMDKIVQFIGQVAQNEQRKEIESITNYCNSINDAIGTGNNTWHLNEILNQQYIQDHPLEFQKRLVIAFDGARRDITNTLNQINNLKKDLDEPKTVNQLAHTNYLYTMNSNIKSLLQQLLGERTEKQINSASITSQLNAEVQNIILKSGIIGQIKDGVSFATLGLGILKDLEQRLQNYMREKDIIDFDKISSEAIQAIGAKYSQEIEEHSPYSLIQKTLHDGIKNNANFDLAVSNAQKILKLNENDTFLEDRAHLLEQVQDQQEKDKKYLTDSFNSFQATLSQNKELKESLCKVTFSISTDSKNKGKAGDIYEFIEGFDFSGSKVRTNVATDLVTYHIDYDVQPNSAIINQHVTDVADKLAEIGDYLQSHQGQHNIQEFTQIIKRTNDKLKRITKELEKKLKEIENFKDQKVFIQQESLKLHSSAGRGRGFEGREMVISSYISYLNSMNGKNDNLNINADALELLAYNIGKGGLAAGKKQGKEKLETYFSLFSAMMMFDDVANMAEEAAKQIQSNSSVETLHVYNLNGMYVPSSVILMNMYNSLMGEASIISASSTARATISIKPNPPKSLSDIKVKIQFLSGYQSFMNQLYKQVQ